MDHGASFSAESGFLYSADTSDHDDNPIRQEQKIRYPWRWHRALMAVKQRRIGRGLPSLEDFGEFLYFKVSTVDARRNHEQNFAAGQDKAAHL